jgi:hypothetical protein
MTAGNTDNTQPSLLERIYNSTIRIVHDFIIGIRKNIVIFLICLVLAEIPLVAWYISKLDTYEASFTVFYDELVRKIYGDRLQKINSLVKRGEVKRISAYMQVDTKIASTLKKVSGENILGEDLTKDLNTDKIPFVVKIISTDSNTIPALQQGIVHFLELGNEYMSDRKKLRIEETEEEITFINQQLTLLDSLKRNYNVNSVVMERKGTRETSPGSLYEFSYDIFKKKQELMRKQKMPNSIQVIDDAIVSDEGKKPLILALIIGGFLAVFLYIMLIGFIIPVLRYKD